MSDRSLTIWKLLITFTLLSIISGGFSLYPKNKKYRKIIAKSSRTFGTDKELENIISYLEGRLEERSQFQFEIENTPMMLTNVLGLADGSGRRIKRNRNALRVAFVYQRNEHFQAQIDYRGSAYTITVGDTIPNIGTVDVIDGTQVIIKTDNGLKIYPAPGYQSVSYNDDIDGQDVTSTKKIINN